MVKKLVFVFLIVVVAIAMAMIYLQKQLHAKVLHEKDSQKPVYFEIKGNQSVRQIARNLFARKMIDDPELFYRYLQFTKKDRKIKKGNYQIPGQVSIISLIDIFVSGKTATKTVTIPEGRTSWEVYSLLKTIFKLDSLVFDSLVHDRTFVKNCGISSISLEGYLFPDTYHFSLKPTEKEILKTMTNQFTRRIKNIDHEKSWIYRKHGLNGLMTLASIVEEEAAVISEQQEIAGIFVNRLKQNWPMGADPTVRFAIKKLTGPLYLSELNIESAYNTRKYTGLPPGPISSPGEDAIRASTKPNETDNMYFVAKDDGSREHYFSKNLKAHNYYKTVRKDNRTGS